MLLMVCGAEILAARRLVARCRAVIAHRRFLVCGFHVLPSGCAILIGLSLMPGGIVVAAADNHLRQAGVPASNAATATA